MASRMPCLVVVNQTVGPTFTDWLVRLAGECGPVDLWTGNPPAQPLAGVTVQRAPAYDRSSVASRLRTWLLFTLVTTGGLFRYGAQVPVFVVTNPPFMPLAAWLVYKFQRRPYGLLEWDIYPHILDPMGLLNSGHLLYRLWQTWHGRALASADLVVTIGERMAGTLRSMARQPSLPVVVIPTWVNADAIRPHSRSENPFAQQHGLGDRLVVLYSGNLGATHAIESLLQAAERLRRVGDIQFLVIGDGAKRSLVEAAIEAGRVPNLRLLPRQPASQLTFVLSSADVGVVTLAAGYEGLSMPSKTYDLMAAGTAILGISRPPNDLEAAIVRHKCGANFAPESTAAIADWIRALTADPACLSRLRSASRAAVDNYSADYCQPQLTEAVRQTLLR